MEFNLMRLKLKSQKDSKDLPNIKVSPLILSQNDCPPYVTFV